MDLINRQMTINALAKEMPSLTTPDGSGEFDRDIQIIDEAYVDCMQIIHELPSAQEWIPTSERFPEADKWVLVTCDEDVTIMAMTNHKEWYYEDGDFHWGPEVVAWMPLMEPYRKK